MNCQIKEVFYAERMDSGRDAGRRGTQKQIGSSQGENGGAAASDEREKGAGTGAGGRLGNLRQGLQHWTHHPEY